jgi:hypothetical protein
LFLLGLSFLAPNCHRTDKSNDNNDFVASRRIANPNALTLGASRSFFGSPQPSRYRISALGRCLSRRFAIRHAAWQVGKGDQSAATFAHFKGADLKRVSNIVLHDSAPFPEPAA